jgi:hypothetical protein
MYCTILKDNYQLEGEDRHIKSIISYVKGDIMKERILAIKKMKKEEADKAKMLLPAFFPSGVFRGGKKAENLVKHSGIIHLDIDGKQRAERVLSYLDTTNVLFLFRSPRGGVKVGFRVTPPQDNRHHKWAWECLDKDFAFGLSDAAGKPVNKQCNLSYDPEAYLNLEAKVFTPPAMPEERPIYFNPMEVRGIDDALRIAERAVQNTGITFRPGQRNLYVFKICCILNRMGVEQNIADRLLAGRFEGRKFDGKEINITLRGVYERYRNEFGSRPIKSSKSGLL